MTRTPLSTHPVRDLAQAVMLLTLSLLLVAVGYAGSEGTVLRVPEDEDTIVQVKTRVRHTTVLVLPAGETILDFVLGDAEYWHLTGSSNVAFLKPLEKKAETNAALVCESGKIYSFVASEDSGPPHLIVRIERPEEDERKSRPGAHRPAFVARDQVTAYQQLAAQAAAQARDAQAAAGDQIQQARNEADAAKDAFRESYPRRLKFPYRFEKQAYGWPFLVTGMWHDGRFTYLRSSAQESPALYELKDGEPSLVAYDLHEDGLYIARHVLGDGWLIVGEKKVRWRFNPKDLEP